MKEMCEIFAVEHRVVRAVNLDGDLNDPEVLEGYWPGEHVLDAVRRIAVSLQDGARTRAWSITGPYGSGKSSFAHFLTSLLSNDSDARFKIAMGVLKESDDQLIDLLKRERRRLEIQKAGVIAAAVVAEREPVIQALVRALDRGVSDYFGGRGRKPAVVGKVQQLARAKRIDGDELVALVEEISAHAPLLVIVDELGKNLEYAASGDPNGDLYALQRLAEYFSSRESFGGGILTLAHLAFEDYLGSAGDARRREWRKIHGRFDDIPFVANRAHSLNLLSTALSSSATGKLAAAIVAESKSAEATAIAATGGGTVPSAFTGAPDATYPLHPIAAAILPAISSSLGQHDRSLVAYMTSDAPHALPAFLASHLIDDKDIPFVRVSDLYDYFVADGGAMATTNAVGDRLREIKTRIDDHRRDETELKVLKTIGLLNLAGGSDLPVASAEVIEAAVVSPGGSATERRGIKAVLKRLVEKRVITYRDFAGEYRVWEGSDFDFGGAIALARERLESRKDERCELEVVAEARPLRYAVAQRHSQEVQTLRYFETRYVLPADLKKVMLDAMDPVGLIAYVVGNGAPPKTMPAATEDGRPLIVIWPKDADQITRAALDYAAAKSVLDEAPELVRDPVARWEMAYRVTALRDDLLSRIDVAFDPTRAKCSAEGKPLKVTSAASVSRRLSEICDVRFSSSAVVRNEMINRNELTSQGAKARRKLLEAMILHEHEEKLGIDGYGPERAIYEAVLHSTGLHRETTDGWVFSEPAKDSDLYGVWTHLNKLIDGSGRHTIPVDRIYDELTRPPFGMKRGVIPLVLTALLQYRIEDVFLYQDGSFQPVVEAAHLERLLKTPDRFALKRASLVGIKASVFTELHETLGIDSSATMPAALRNKSTLAIVRPLMRFVSQLPEYSKQTGEVSDRAQHVVAALLAATDPDELLFTELPRACDVPVMTSKPDAKSASRYVKRLREALRDLSAVYPKLLDRVGELLRAGFDVPGPRTALREDLRTRSRHLLTQVIDPKLRAFLMTSMDEKLEDDEWLEALALTLSSKPPMTWNDHDVVSFEALVAERARWFKRLELLHFEMNQRGEGFDARRVTITESNGYELAELVSVDPSTRKQVDGVLNAAIEELEKHMGKSAPTVLLGILTERIVQDAEASTQERPKKRRKIEAA